MRPLEGRRVAVLESRMREELSDMVRRLGGQPVSAPAVHERPRLDDVAADVERLAASEYRVVIFLTGAAASAMLREAELLGRLAASVRALQANTVACRGPKPLAVLKRHGVVPAVTTVKPHTTQELLTALQAVELRDMPTLLVHYGETNAELADALRVRGARLFEACPYEWVLPEDPQPLAALVGDALNDRLDAILFTSQVQARHLFDVAREMRLVHELAAALNRSVIVGAVGPVCAAALKHVGVTPDVIPASPNMVSLVAAIADYFSLTGNGPENHR
jgi:uroporphyrinogen-III synthase